MEEVDSKISAPEPVVVGHAELATVPEIEMNEKSNFKEFIVGFGIPILIAIIPIGLVNIFFSMQSSSTGITSSIIAWIIALLFATIIAPLFGLILSIIALLSGRKYQAAGALCALLVIAICVYFLI